MTPPPAQPYVVRLADGHEVSDERERLDMPFVLGALAGVYWTRNNRPGLSERSWANCLPFGVYGPDGGQVGFARLLTDYAFRAHLGDVFIRPESRGAGLSKALVGAILGHPELETVQHWTLTTADAHGLYARYGFRMDQGDGKRMVLDRTPPG